VQWQPSQALKEAISAAAHLWGPEGQWLEV
jgi:hypothetical protein